MKAVRCFLSVSCDSSVYIWNRIVLLTDRKLGDRGGTVVKVLCYKLEGLWFDPRWCHWNFLLTYSLRSHYDPGVDSAFNRNEYQENFLGVNAAGAYGWQPYHLPMPLSWNMGTLTSWNPLGHSRPVTRLMITPEIPLLLYNLKSPYL